MIRGWVFTWLLFFHLRIILQSLSSLFLYKSGKQIINFFTGQKADKPYCSATYHRSYAVFLAAGFHFYTIVYFIGSEEF